MIVKKSTLSYFVICCFLVVFAIQIKAQPVYAPLEFNVTSATGDKGDVVCLDFTVNNFINVEAFQLNISYNATLVSPVCPPDLSGSALSPNINGGFFNCNNKDNGYINIVWFDDAITIPDGSNLFTICFNIVGNPGNTTPVFFNGLITEIQICQAGQNNATICTGNVEANSGTITITPNTLLGFFNKCDADGIAGLNNGKLVFYATGGNPPYSYNINGGLYSGVGFADGERATIDPIPMGTYNILITDASGAIFNLGPILISDNIPITYDTPIVQNARCYNRPTGSITLNNIQGGLSPYTYLWSNFISGVSSDDIMLADLQTGLYTVTITDFAGCIRTDSFVLTLDTLKLNVTIDSASCLGVNNGRVTLNANGGLPFLNDRYAYSLNGGSYFKFDNGFTLNNRAPGPLNLMVQDSLLCQAIFEPIIIPFKRTLAITVDSTDVSCFGKNDGFGQITVTPFANYFFTLDGVTFGNIGNTFTTPPLSPGNYSVSVRDTDNCRISGTFSIDQPTQLQINPDVTQPNCTPTGSISLNPSGGIGPYTYDWLPVAANVNTLTDLTSGVYRVTVSDANGCSDSLTVNINPAGSLNINATISTPLACHNQNNAGATVEIFSANGPFNINWRDSSGMILSNMQSLINLSAGKYYVSVADNLGCGNIDSIEILNPPALNLNILPTQPTCFGFANGSLGANVSGGTGSILYEWRKTGESNIIGSLSALAPVAAGSYDLLIRDVNGCIKDTSFVLNQPDKITLGEPEIIEVRCFGQAVGRARMLDLNLDYLWSDGGTSFFTINLLAGTNWVIANDGTCVSDTLFFEVGTVDQIRIDQTNSEFVDPLCFGSSDGSISLRATGGVSTVYNYNWPEISRTGSDINNLEAGTYRVEITDSFGCTVMDSIVLDEPAQLELFLNTFQTVELNCKNQDNGQIAVATTGGQPGQKSFQWDNSQTTNQAIISNLLPGTYCVTATDANNCTADFCYTLDAPIPLIGIVATPESPKCFGDTTCISIASATGGTGDKYTFQINQGPRFPIDACVTVFAGPYLVNIIDSAGCSVDTLISISQPEPISVDLGQDIEIQLGTASGIINASIVAPAGVQDIAWTPFETIECMTMDCQVIEVTPITTTLYKVLVTDNNGCLGSDDIEVRVKNTRNVYFANVFSPNGDGMNDHFQVVIGPGVTRVLSFAVFDRWGNQVFFKEDFIPDEAGTDGWDGTFKGKVLDPGVFVYYTRVLFADQRELDFSGSVTLIDKRRN